jgi:hypothetical protein
MNCDHDLSERETACADGMCPMCLRAENAALREAAGKVTCNECGMYMPTPSGKWSPCPDCADLRALLEKP